MFDELISRTRSALKFSSTEIPDDVSRIANWMTNTLNCVPDGLLVTNGCGDVLFMNSRAEQLTGWSVEEALQRCSSEIFRLLDASSGAPVDSPLREAYVEEQVFRSRDCLLAAAHGSPTRIEYAAGPVHSEKGELMGALVVFREQAFDPGGN